MRPKRTPSKFYAVHRGRQPGVFRDWAACREQVTGVRGARWAAFRTQHDAEQFVRSGLRAAAPAPAARGRAFYGVRSSNPAVPSAVFDTWAACQAHVHRQRGVAFRKFPTRDQAENFAHGAAAHDWALLETSPDEFARAHKLPPPAAPFSARSVVYCDGSALANGSARATAGIGVYFRDEPDLSLSEPLTVPPYTNNRAEVLAASRALQLIWRNLTAVPAAAPRPLYVLRTDSEYVVRLLSALYTAYDSPAALAAVSNSDLVVPLVQHYLRVKHWYLLNAACFDPPAEFALEWVRGHDNEPGNEEADRLAREAAASA
ncbi:AaceriABL017Cp [[Ashbya] aceris (nom. inval.)]|nr:AaceriABL017Cp [[Ashbya] aceris (nom. inval.)]